MYVLYVKKSKMTSSDKQLITEIKDKWNEKYKDQHGELLILPDFVELKKYE